MYLILTNESEDNRYVNDTFYAEIGSKYIFHVYGEVAFERIEFVS